MCYKTDKHVIIINKLREKVKDVLKKKTDAVLSLNLRAIDKKRISRDTAD